MKNKITLLLALFVMAASVSMMGQTRDVGDFNAVSISSGLSVTLKKASSPSVDISIKKGSANDLITKVKDGVLYVKVKSKFGGWGNSVNAKVTVNYTELEKIKVSSGCSVKSANIIEARNMEVEVSSGSTAKFDIDANRIEVEVSSGSTLKLTGRADKGHFEASSGSTLNAYHFKTDEAEVEANSGSSLSIHVDETLDATAGSGASITYTGKVKNKNIDSGWSGSIKRKG